MMCFKIPARYFHSCLTTFYPNFVFFTQAAKRGILSTARGRGVHVRGRGALRARGRGSRGRGRGAPLHAVVDHRPRALQISGFSESDHVDLLPHFAVSQPINYISEKGDLISTINQYDLLIEAVGGRSESVKGHRWGGWTFSARPPVRTWQIKLSAVVTSLLWIKAVCGVVIQEEKIQNLNINIALKWHASHFLLYM